MSIKDYWWNKAIEASNMVGWFPTVILAQWQLETGNFTSNNLVKNNNIAGQTWQPYMGIERRGTARPSNEGGYYIRYDDPVDGYVDFIMSNRRYSNVLNMPTEDAQIDEIAAQGWAVDPNYASKLKSILAANTAAGYVLEVEPVLKKWVASTIYFTWIKPEWDSANEKGDEATKENMHILAEELRAACGMQSGDDFE